MLSCDVPQINDAIQSEACAPHLAALLRFPDSAPSLNPVLAGYYGKVIGALFKRAPEPFLRALDAHRDGGRIGFLSSLVARVEMPSLAELLTTLTTPLEALAGGAPPPPLMIGGLVGGAPRRPAGEHDPDQEPWLDVSRFATSLVGAAAASESAEVHEQVAAVFGALVGQYGWGAMVADRHLLAALLDVALDAPRQSARACATQMLDQLLKLYAAERALGDGEAAARDARVRPLVEAIGERIEGFVAQLNHEPVRAAAAARAVSVSRAPPPRAAAPAALRPSSPGRSLTCGPARRSRRCSRRTWRPSSAPAASPTAWSSCRWAPRG